MMDRITAVVGVVLCSLLSVSAVQAQSIQLDVTGVSSWESADVTGLNTLQTSGDESTTRSFNAAECKSAVLTFRFQSIPTDKKSLFFFGGGSNCLDSAQRMDTTSSCEEKFSTQINGQATLENLEVPVSELVDCSATASETIVVLAADQSEGDAGEGYVELTIPIDVSVPSVPTDVTGNSGDTALSIKWSFSEANLYQHKIYMDVSNGCDSTLVVAGEEAPADSEEGVSVFATENGATTSYALDGSTVTGFDYGTKATIGIVAVDRGRNNSVVSATACIERVQTVGFWQNYCQSSQGMEDCEVASCSISQPGRHNAWVLMLALLGIALRRRSVLRRGRREARE